MGIVGDIGCVEERSAIKADIDESSLHAWQHPTNAAVVDISDQTAAVGALDEHFLKDAVRNERDAGLARGHVDAKFGAPGRNRVVDRVVFGALPKL